jgi:c-di-GMP-binding flagellar brake protein YcgR
MSDKHTGVARWGVDGTVIAIQTRRRYTMAESTPDGAAAIRNSAIQSRYLTDADEVAQVFKVLRDQRAELQLRFDQEAQPYRGKVLDLKDGSILIEDIHPRDGMRLLREGRPFAIAARIDGLYVHATQNRAHKADSERSVPFFHIALPRSMLCQQRRRAARFRLPLRVAANGARVTLYPAAKDATPLSGSTIDISAGGCRAEFSNCRFRPIHDDDPLTGCALSIPNLLELEASAAIRHSSLDTRRHVFTCGIEFTEMDVTDRRRLEQFVQSLARISQPA